MFTYQNANDLINSKQFVPIDELIAKLIKNNNKEIILTGGRGTGKTVSLYYMQEKTLYTDNPTIYTCFDSISTLGKEPNDLFNEKDFIHYYELTMCFKLMSYLNDYYKTTYNKEFKDFEKILNEIATDTDSFIHNKAFENRKLKRYLQTGEISKQIIEKLKNDLETNNVTLAIDRFDWTNTNSIYVQNLLSNYFTMFKKTVITTDDETVNKDGKDVIECNYGNNLNYLKQIVSERIQLYNVTNNCCFNGNMITDQIYRTLIEKCKGNISLILDIIYETINLCEWQEQSSKLKSNIDYATKNQLSINEKVKKMGSTPKLYI